MTESGSRARKIKIPWRRLRRHARTTDPPEQTPPKRPLSMSPLASLSSESTLNSIEKKIRAIRDAFPPHFDLELGPWDTPSESERAAIRRHLNQGPSQLSEVHGLIEEVATLYDPVLKRAAKNHEPALIFGSESGLPPAIKEDPEEKAERERYEARSRFFKELAEECRRLSGAYILREYGEQTYRNLLWYVEDEAEKSYRHRQSKVILWVQKCLRDGCVGWPGSPVKTDTELDWATGGRLKEQNDVWKWELEQLRRSYKRC